MLEKGYKFSNEKFFDKYDREENGTIYIDKSILTHLAIGGHYVNEYSEHYGTEILDSYNWLSGWGKKYSYQIGIFITDGMIDLVVYEHTTSFVLGFATERNVTCYFFYKNIQEANSNYVKKMKKVLNNPSDLKAKVKSQKSDNPQKLLNELINNRYRVSASQEKSKETVDGQYGFKYVNPVNKKTYFEVWAANEDPIFGVIWYGRCSQDVIEEETPSGIKNAINNIFKKTTQKSKEFTNIKVATSNNDTGEDRSNYTYEDVLTDSGASYFSQEIPSDTNTRLNKKVSKILGIIQVIGSVISVLSLALLGIKYMVGSVEEKSDYKKELPIYALGAIMVFAISNLLSVIYNWATKIS